VDEKGLQIAKSIIGGIFHPDLSLFNLSKESVPYLLVETLAIAFLGTIIGAILSVPFAFLATSNIVPKPVSWLTRFLLFAIRTLPSIVYGLMCIRATGSGSFAGVLTVSLASVGMLGKLLVHAIEELDVKVLESMTSVGCSTFEKIRCGSLPQLIAIFLSVTIYRFDMNLRDAATLGLVGAGGIGAPLIFARNSYKWEQVGSILIGLVVLVLIIEVVSNMIRSKLVKG